MLKNILGREDYEIIQNIFNYGYMFITFWKKKKKRKAS